MNHKNRTIVFIFIITLLLIIIGILSFQISNLYKTNKQISYYSQLKSCDSTPFFPTATPKKIITPTLTTITPQPTKPQLSFEINGTYKPWVSNANYNYSVSVNSYRDGFYKLSDIIVPYINLNSLDAVKANKEIKELYEKLAQYFKERSESDQVFGITSSYRSFVNGDILSIIIETISSGTDVPKKTYYTYNFNLKTLKALNFDDLYIYKKYTQSNIDLKIKQEIIDYLTPKLSDLKDLTKDTGDGGYYPSGTNFDTYVNKSYQNYQNSINNNTILSFIDSNHKLNIIVVIEMPIGYEKFNTILTLD